jgi:hypothetical protein
MSPDDQELTADEARPSLDASQPGQPVEGKRRGKGSREGAGSPTSTAADALLSTAAEQGQSAGVVTPGKDGQSVAPPLGLAAGVTGAADHAGEGKAAIQADGATLHGDPLQAGQAGVQAGMSGKGANTGLGAPSTDAGAEHGTAAPKLVEQAKLLHAAALFGERLDGKPADDLLAPNPPQAPGAAGTAGVIADGGGIASLAQGAGRAPDPAANLVQGSVLGSTSAAVPLAGLAVEIAARAQSGHSRFDIRLDPPELGRIDVQLDIDRTGQVTSRLLVDKPETLDVLRRDAGDIERALQQAGLRSAENGLQFALRDQSFAGRQDNGGAIPNPARLTVATPDIALPTAPATAQGRLLRIGGIDIHV